MEALALLDVLAVVSYLVQTVLDSGEVVGTSAAIDAVRNAVHGVNLIKVPAASLDNVVTIGDLSKGQFVGSGIDLVIPGTADQRIIATITVESIVARPAIQLVVAIWGSGGLAACQAVSHHMIGAAVAVNYVASAKAVYVLIVVTTLDPIVVVGTHAPEPTRAGNGGSKRHPPTTIRAATQPAAQRRWLSAPRPANRSRRG